MHTSTSENSTSQLEICYVEDDDDLREVVVKALRENGFAVRGYSGSRELYRDLLSRPCHIVILDIELPGEDGLTIAANLRASSDIGIVMLTACGDTDDRVQGLLGGADAYLVKPVEIRELVATLKSLARRLGVERSALPPTNGWMLVLDGWSLRTPGGVEISLTASERDVLHAVMDTPDLPVSRETLITRLGHDTDYYLPHRLDMLISRLRRKVLENAGTPLPLRAVRGAGFAFSSTRNSTRSGTVAQS